MTTKIKNLAVDLDIFILQCHVSLPLLSYKALGSQNSIGVEMKINNMQIFCKVLTNNEMSMFSKQKIFSSKTSVIPSHSLPGLDILHVM